MQDTLSAAPLNLAFPYGILKNDSTTPLVAEPDQVDVLAVQQRTAIRLSNYSVALLELGQYVPAVEVLSRALKMCRPTMDESVDFPAPLSTTFDGCMASKQNGMQFSYGEQRYLYQQPIHIPLNIGLNYRACVMMSAMVTFNLALAKQLTAIKGLVADPATVLRRASKLYELAFSMQQEEGFDHNCLFTLATVNNLGLIHSQLNQRKAADQCFEYLLSTLMYLASSNCGNLEYNPFFEGFLRNATTGIQKSVSAPAA